MRESKRQEADRQCAVAEFQGGKREKGKGGRSDGRRKTGDAGARTTGPRMQPRLRPTVTGPRKSRKSLPPKTQTVRLLHDHLGGPKHDTLSLPCIQLEAAKAL